MAGTATEYIQHHLTHLNNIGAKQGSIVDFSVFNFDTAVFSILMMLLAVWLMYSAAKKATRGVPGKWQCAVYRSFGSDRFRLGHPDERYRPYSG